MLQHAHFEATPGPNLVQRVARCLHVWPHLGHILEFLSDDSTVRNFEFGYFLIPFRQFCDFRVKDSKVSILGLTILKFGFRTITNFVDFTKFFIDFHHFRNKNHKFFPKI